MTKVSEVPGFRSESVFLNRRDVGSVSISIRESLTRTKVSSRKPEKYEEEVKRWSLLVNKITTYSSASTTLKRELFFAHQLSSSLL